MGKVIGKVSLRSKHVRVLKLGATEKNVKDKCCIDAGSKTYQTVTVGGSRG